MVPEARAGGTRAVRGLAVLLAMAAGACLSSPVAEQDPPDDRTLGQLGLGLTLPDDSEIDQVSYTLTRAGSDVRAGVIAIGPDRTGSNTLTDLDPGDGYLVTLRTVRTLPAGAPGCEGASMPFAVMAGATTIVNVVLQCDDISPEDGTPPVDGPPDPPVDGPPNPPVDGPQNPPGNVPPNTCPHLTAASATPAMAPVGHAVALNATAADPDAADAITFQWSAASGTFSSPTTAMTFYTCSEVGEYPIQLTVSNGPTSGCADTIEPPVVVTCTAPEEPAVDAGPAAADGGVDVDSGPADTGAPDSRVPAVDSGSVDPGPIVVDSGAAEVDSGTPEVDSGAPEVDSGAAEVDTGTPAVDSGAPEVDSGAPEIDSGTPEVDSGTPQVDTGTPAVDSGTPQVDTGTPPAGLTFSAGCMACANTNCNPNIFSGQNLVTDCADSICHQIVQCAIESNCALNADNFLDPGSISRCYCGPVTADVCDQGSFVPDGPCQELFEQGVGTSDKAEVILRLTDATYSGADGFLLLQCVSEFCPNECIELIQ